MERHQSWLVRLLAQLLHASPAAAEDLAQETFVRAFLALDTLSEQSSFKAFVRVIGTRLAYNASRDQRNRIRLNADLQSPPEAPGSSLEAREVLDRSLAALPFSYREILVLRHVEELRVDEIAQLLALGESATKMRLKRAREAFLDVHDKLSGI
ncbi:MAG: RNA polymerase sigma factor [Myxococcales bacterium]|nr:RNA polymerase sigma factor [Myxococcales bacterium]